MSTLQSASDRVHVLEIVGNAILGGMENVVLRLVERLPAECFRITALCPFESLFTSRLRAAGADVLVVPMPLTGDPSWNAVQTACALSRTQGVDVLHAHMPNAHAVAALAGRLANKPVLATVHARQLTTLELEAHGSCGTHLSVVCRSTYFHALAMGVDPARLHVIGNGVDTDVYAPGAGRVGVLRQRLKMAADAPLLGYVGRLDHEKGPDLFIRAALRACDARADLCAVLVGDGPMRAEMQALIDASGMADRIVLAGLSLDMPAVYGELDVLLSSSRSEAMPLAVLEAMACGLPVVAARVGGVPDLVQHGLTGWLVAEGDVDNMAERVLALVGGGAGAVAVEAATMGAHGRRRVADHFALTDSVRQTADLLQRLAQPKSPPMRMVPSANGVAPVVRSATEAAALTPVKRSGR